MRYHDARTIGDPRSTWGLLEGNPTQAIIRHNGALLPLDFCVNVTLNRERAITRFFCGDPLAAHDAGCAFSKQTAMVACERPFPIVVTTNSGYPLDQNLYQTVKGMSAAAQIVTPGGYIATAVALQRRLPRARQLQEAALRPRLAAGAPRHDRGARLLALRPVGGAAAGAHPAEGAGRPAERAAPRTRCGARTSSRSRTWARPWRASWRGSDGTRRWPCCPRARRRSPMCAAGPGPASGARTGESRMTSSSETERRRRRLAADASGAPAEADSGRGHGRHRQRAAAHQAAQEHAAGQAGPAAAAPLQEGGARARPPASSRTS